MEEKNSYGQFDDEDQGGEPGKEPQDEKQGAEDFCEQDQDQRPAVTDMKGIEENGFLTAEVHQLGKTMIYTDKQSESEAKQQDCQVEAGFGIAGRKKFLHVIGIWG